MKRVALPCWVSPAIRGQSGLTLVELMIAMTIGLLIVAAATAVLLSGRSSYLMLDDEAQMQATGRYAIEIVSRTVRLAAFADRRAEGSLAAAGFAGLDARSLKSRSPGIDSPLMKSVNGSDVLAIRFPGSGSGANGDGTMVNCAGFGIAAGAAEHGAAGWSVFYVAEDATGEPELYCKYQGESGWSSQAIARGVESFRVLYGIDTDGDDLPNRFVNAAALNALDDTLALVGQTADARAADRNQRSFWNKVVCVKLALLVRGAQASAREHAADVYDLFGDDYGSALSGEDPGTRIRVADLSKQVQGKLRRVFSATVYLPNRTSMPVGGPT